MAGEQWRAISADIGSPNQSLNIASNAFASVGRQAGSILDQMQKQEQQKIANKRANDLLSIQQAQESRAVDKAADEGKAYNAIIKNSNIAIPTTKPGEVTTEQITNYNKLIESNKKQASIHQGIKDRILSKYDKNNDGKISDTEGGVYTTAYNTQLKNADSNIAKFSVVPEKPVGADIPLNKEEYKAAILSQIGYQPTTGSGGKAILDYVNKQVESQFDKKGNSITPWQQYQIRKDLQETNSIALENKALMLNNESLFKNKNIPKDPIAANREMNRILDKKYTPKGTILEGISKLVTDEDEDNQANITDNSKELNEILKTKFNGNKKEMLQAIDGYYKRQSTGFFKNWGSGSPMGDALDNFISKYK